MSFIQNEIYIRSTDPSDRIIYIITIGQNLYKEECSVLISSLTLRNITNYLSRMRKQEIKIGIGSKSNFLVEVNKSQIVSFTCETVEPETMAYIRKECDYHYRLDMILKEWNLITSVAKKNDIPVTINVDYINGVWEYYIENYVSNPIDYSLNARHYDSVLLANTPSAYECDPKFIKRMLNMGDKNDMIKMYFAPKVVSKYQTVLIEYPLINAECQMYYMFVAEKTELVDIGDGLKISCIIKKQNDEKEIRIQEWVSSTCDTHKELFGKYSTLIDSENENDHILAYHLLEDLYLSLPQDIAEDIWRRLEELSTEQ